MKKKLMRCAALTLALLMLQVSVFATAKASELIRRTMVSATATGNGEVSFDFFITGTKNLEQIGVSRIDIFSESEGLLATYRYFDDGYEHMMGYDEYAYGNAVVYEGEPGESYYAKLNFYAYDGTLADMTSMVTDSVEAD